MKHRSTMAVIGLVLLSCSVKLAVGQGQVPDWGWYQYKMLWNSTHTCRLSDNNGAKVLDQNEVFDDETEAEVRAVGVAIEDVTDGGNMNVVFYYYDEGDGVWKRESPVKPRTGYPGTNGAFAFTSLVANPDDQVHCIWYDESNERILYADTLYPDRAATPWADQEIFAYNVDVSDIAMDAWKDGGDVMTYIAFSGDPPGTPPQGVYVMRSTSAGDTWDAPVLIEECDGSNVSIAAGPGQAFVYVAFQKTVEDVATVCMYVSDDKGVAESWELSREWTDAQEPCVAAEQRHDEVVVIWIHSSTGKVYCAWNEYRGDPYRWNPEPNPAQPPFYGALVESYKYRGDGFTFSHPSVALVDDNDGDNSNRNALFAARVHWNQRPTDYVSTTFMRFGGTSGNHLWNARAEHWLNRGPCDETANPSIAAWEFKVDVDAYDRQAVCAWAFDGSQPAGTDDAMVGFAAYGMHESRHLLIPPVTHDGSGSRLRLAPDGSLMYCSGEGANIHAGPVAPDGMLLPIMAGAGVLSAVAVDGDGEVWTAYTRDSTLWCNVPWDSSVRVYCGSSAYPPGQPSITIYPIKDNGDQVAALTFAVYDSAGETSRVLFAKVKAGSVLLDTVESYAALGDSFPSVNVAKDSMVYCIWQHGDSIAWSRMEFDVGCWTAHGDAWGSLDTLAPAGYHPSTWMKDTFLFAVWAEEQTVGMNTVFEVQGKSCNVVSSAWGGWQDGGASGESDANVKTNPVYAGAGVTVWQEQVSNLWRIMGEVRGDTVTLVYSDSGAYHPHAVAESSAVSPSIDQVRVSVLYTDGVVFEVDSALYDTGKTKFVCCSLDVSSAGSNATASNNGVKFIRKDGSDSLFAAYADFDGDLMYARSADGSEWTRVALSADVVQPAIAADSSGAQWTAYFYDGSNHVTRVEASYGGAAAWSAPFGIYNAESPASVGPVSLAGASSASNRCAWAAFLYFNGSAKPPFNFIIVAKFDGTHLFLDTLASGLRLCDPCIAVEPDGEGGDFIHVCWEDDGEVRYTMTTSAIDGGDWGGNLSVSWETVANLSNTSGVASTHPVVGADPDRVVVAWAERSTPEILVCARSTDSSYANFEDTVNVSQTGDASDYPSIAMGDSVVVVWEEHKSGTDYDIYASVEFDEGFCIVDNTGFATYPFAVFQNKASGDTAIPYIRLVYSSQPEADYYEVGYTDWNLKELGTGGEQSGGNTGPLLRPELSACRPNPFSRRTQIRYQFPKAGNVLLRVYDASGRAVRTLQNGPQKAGAYTVDWDGTDGRGREVPNGIYFYRLDTPGFRDVKKAVVLK